MSNFQSFGFGQDDAGIGSRAEKFKGEKGKSYRIGFAWWEGMEGDGNFTLESLTPKSDGDEDKIALTPKFIGGPRNYIQGVGYVINKGPEYTALAGQPPKMMIATIVVSWALGKNGQPSKESLFSGMPDVMPWIFSQDKYEKLKKMHMSGYPMHSYDVQIDCEDTQYQKFNFLPAQQSIFKEMLKSGNEQGQEVARHIIERVRALAPNLEREIGQNLTIDQLKEKMGVETSGPVGNVVAGDQEVDGLLDSMLND
jgi:hypothetical protein